MILLIPTLIFLLSWKPAFLTSEWVLLGNEIQKDLTSIRLRRKSEARLLAMKLLPAYQGIFQKSLESGSNITEPLRFLIEQINLMSNRELVRKKIWAYLKVRLLSGLLFCAAIRVIWSGPLLHHWADFMVSSLHFVVIIFGLYKVHSSLALDWFKPGLTQSKWMEALFLQKSSLEHAYIEEYRRLELETGHSYFDEMRQISKEYASNSNKNIELDLDRKADMISVWEVILLVPCFFSILAFPFYSQVNGLLM